MKEFDKIYVAKYGDILTRRQLAEDLRTNKIEIQNVVTELEQKGIKEIYVNITDEEWEKLEKLDDEQIRFKYYKKSKIIQKTIKRYFFELFGIPTIKEELEKFEQFDEYVFKGKFAPVIIDEEEKWKQIPGFEYSLSNYGRIRSDKTKKIKSSRIKNYMRVVDLYKDGKRYTLNVVRMEANLFIRELLTEERIVHIDNNINNNFYKNLKIIKIKNKNVEEK